MAEQPANSQESKIDAIERDEIFVKGLNTGKQPTIGESEEKKENLIRKALEEGEKMAKQTEKPIVTNANLKTGKVESEVIHTESVDAGTVKCPRCRSGKVNWIFTKRGISIKCLTCGFDSHFIHDFQEHSKMELEAFPLLKRLFPQLVFVENIPVDAEPITGEKGNQTVRYDAGAYWFGSKIAKLKIFVIRNQTRRHYIYEANENYIQGRPSVFEYLAKIDALALFYFVDEPNESEKLAMASCREIKNHASKTIDRFMNEQYSLVLEIRGVIIKDDVKSFRNFLFRNLIDHINENLYII